MSEIKLSLTVALRGSTMFSKEECLKTTQETITTKNGRKRTVTKVVEDWDKMEKHTMRVTDTDGTNPEIITFHTRKSKSCSQSINMSKEAYDYMTSKDSCLPNIKPYVWAKMNKKQRLEAHLDLVCKALKGNSYTYKVFDD